MGQIVIVAAALFALLTAGVNATLPTHYGTAGPVTADAIMPSGGG